jgi:hypothetical protein
MTSGLGLKGREITTRFNRDAIRKGEMWQSNDSGGGRSGHITGDRKASVKKSSLFGGRENFTPSITA